MTNEVPLDPPLDLLIVGAGISGIGMAAQYARGFPGKRFAMLEKREAIGGTWDLFRYPGIRSDSDMFTLSYAFHPWTRPEAIAEGDAIRAYLDEVVDAYDLRRHIRVGQTVSSADWDSAAALWRVTARGSDGAEQVHEARFLFMGTGYYDYEAPHDAQIPGLADFAGAVIHPQFWPADAAIAGKRVVVIGSGATAVTLVPSLVELGAQVTMLQRTPTWYLNRPHRDRFADLARRFLPAGLAHRLVRTRNVRMQDYLFTTSRKNPSQVAAFLTNETRKLLGNSYDPAAFSPPYGPWEQRLCLVPDADLFDAVKSGKAEIVTGTIRAIEPGGVRLDDGRLVEADVIVTATGLKLSLLGKTTISVDGEPVDFSQHYTYRSCMFSNVPNFAALIGYINASWTLRLDIVVDWLCRLLRQMDAWEADVVTPVLPDDHGLAEDNPLDLFSSGYLRRGRHLMPKSAPTGPWRFGMHYLSDRAELRDAPIDDGILRFARAPSPAGAPTAVSEVAGVSGVAAGGQLP